MMKELDCTAFLYDWEISDGKIPELLTVYLDSTNINDQQEAYTIDANNNNKHLTTRLPETSAHSQKPLDSYLMIWAKFMRREEKNIQNYLLHNEFRGNIQDSTSGIVNTKIEMLVGEIQFRAFDRGLYSARLQNLREEYTKLREKLNNAHLESKLEAVLRSIVGDIDYLKGKEQLTFGNFDSALSNFKSAQRFYEKCWPNSHNKVPDPKLKKALCAFMVKRTCEVAVLCGEWETLPNISENDSLLVENLQKAYVAWTKDDSFRVHWNVLTFFRELSSVGIDVFGRTNNLNSDKRKFGGLLSLPSLETLLLIEENVRQSFDAATGRFHSIILDRLSNLRALKSGGSIINSFYYIFLRAKLLNSMRHAYPTSNSVHSYLDIEKATRNITKMSVSGFWFKLFSTKLIEYYVLSRNVVKVNSIVEFIKDVISDDVAWVTLLDDKFKRDISNLTNRLSETSYFENVLSCTNGKALFVNLFHPLDKDANSKVDKAGFLTICEKFGVSVSEFYAKKDEHDVTRGKAELEDKLNELSSRENLENCEVLIVFLTSHGEADREPGSTECVTFLSFCQPPDADEKAEERISEDKEEKRSIDKAEEKRISVRRVQTILSENIERNCTTRRVFCWIIVDSCRGETCMRLPFTPEESANLCTRQNGTASNSRAVGTLTMEVEPEDYEEFVVADCLDDLESNDSYSFTDANSRGTNVGSLSDFELSSADDLHEASFVTSDSLDSGGMGLWRNESIVEASFLEGETTDLCPNNDRRPAPHQQAIILTSYATLNGFQAYVPKISPDLDEGYSPFVKSVYDVFTLSKVSFEGAGPWRMNNMLKFVNGNMKRFKKKVASDRTGKPLDQPYYEVQRCMYSSSNLEDVILVRESISKLKEISDNIKKTVHLGFEDFESTPRDVDLVTTSDEMMMNNFADPLSESESYDLPVNLTEP
ncbi:uncharacterized protein LOC142353105 isoform X2 [Convolutriloba macropyga]|uniref:uncharacterized protein LOC142353105 isoform X2 n=1 Tax=Convolutriloba macropyga TaxID=536237 RepID=UPI003F520738